MRRFILTTFYAFLFSLAFANTEKDAVTMVSYEQSWLDSEGTLALKNNSNVEIKDVTFEITYLDMQGNPMDYKEFKKRVEIAPGKTKKIDIPAYEHERYYHYYKTPDNSGNPAFKINFELKGINSVEVDDDAKSSAEFDDSFADKFNPENSSNTGEWLGIALLFGLVLVILGVSVGFYVLVAVLAKNRHRNVVLWVLLSIFISPVIIAIVLLIIGNSDDYYDAEQIR